MNRPTIPSLSVVASDAPNVIPMLEQLLEQMETHYRKMLRANRALKIGDLAALHVDGWTLEQLAELQKPHIKGRISIPPIQFETALRTIRRFRRRIHNLIRNANKFGIMAQTPQGQFKQSALS